MRQNGLSRAERERRVARGKRLARLREERTGLSPEAFGLSIDVDGTTIRNLEAGKVNSPQVRVRFAYARGLGLPMRHVFPSDLDRQVSELERGTAAV